MLKLAVIGSPISHSLSPVIHSMAMRYYGIDGTYESIEVTPDTLKEKLNHLSQEKYEGINVTAPLKELIHLYVIDNWSNWIHNSVTNTLYRSEENWRTANTDIDGLLDSMSHFELSDESHILILGGGGTAKTIAYTLTTRYDKVNLSICTRTPTKFEQFLDFIKFAVVNEQNGFSICSQVPKEVVGTNHQLIRSLKNISVHPWEDRIEIAQSSHLVVNATTLGMNNDSPLPLDDDYSSVEAFLDTLYFPKETPLFRKFRIEGRQVLNGVHWFIAQADASFHYWTGKKFPEEVKEEFREYYAKMANRR